jgi:hypothetical protein
MTLVIIITIIAKNSLQNRQSSRSFSCCLDYYYYYLSKNGQYTNVMGTKKLALINLFEFSYKIDDDHHTFIIIGTIKRGRRTLHI